jgi:hypothetical protein
MEKKSFIMKAYLDLGESKTEKCPGNDIPNKWVFFVYLEQLKTK